MGWNGSGGGSTPVKPKATVKKPSPIRGIIAGGLVCVLAIGAYFAFFSGAGRPQTEKATKERGRIKEVTPAKAPTNAIPAKMETAVQAKKRPYPDKAYWPDGTLKKHTRWVKVETNSLSKLSMSVEETTFKNYADQQLAYLVNMQPGAQLVSAKPITFDESFVESFKASLKQEITITDKDTTYQAELKRAVMEVRKDLEARYRAGEDVAKIMNDAWGEMRELSLYSREVADMVDKVRQEKGEMSEADEEDLVKAANQMLKDRGIQKEMALPSALTAKAKMISERRESRAREGRPER